MNVEVVTSLIGSLGFPIVACIYMAYLNKEITDSHKEEMDSIKEALNANTNAISKLEVLINQILSIVSK